MSAAKNNQIHLTQAVPMNSPLTWKLDGDIGKKGLEVVSFTLFYIYALMLVYSFPELHKGY